LLTTTRTCSWCQGWKSMIANQLARVKLKHCKQLTSTFRPRAVQESSFLCNLGPQGSCTHCGVPNNEGLSLVNNEQPWIHVKSFLCRYPSSFRTASMTIPSHFLTDAFVSILFGLQQPQELGVAESSTNLAI
jgi:hypothetical protein